MACNRLSLHTETRNKKNSESTNHNTIAVRNGRMGTGLGVRRITDSSMASRTVRINRRTLTSQVSQFRSSEMECMGNFVVRYSQCSSVAGKSASSYELRASIYSLVACSQVVARCL